MIGWILRLFLGNYNDRILKKLFPILDKVNAWEEKVHPMDDETLRRQTILFRERYQAGESLDHLLPEAFATLREASTRVLGMRHFDVQIIGGIVLHQGNIAEMKTGEGKTLVATLAVYLYAITGNGVHVVTVNDYLAKRDCEWMGPLYEFLGLQVKALQSNMGNQERKEVYAADITYGTTSEFGFDYLRDNMVYSAEDKVQRGHAFCLVDEVDSVLIDEARTPLIISGPSEGSVEKYYVADKVVPRLRAAQRGEDGKWVHTSGDYLLEEKNRHVSLTETGIASVEKILGIQDLYAPENIEIVHAIQQSLRAHLLHQSGKEYIVENGQVIIIDENTGRKMEGRRYSDGLHQAIEAKEHVRIQSENQTLATVTIQNYFKMYPVLAGMTGTAQTEAPEFLTIYKMDVVSIPTHKPVVRIDKSDAIYRSKKAKNKALAERIQQFYEKQTPVLIGTISVESSEELSKLLSKNKIPHSVLNAKQHEKESEIVAQAGALGRVTIATNMAGRGTDIVLGGNPTFKIERYLEKILASELIKEMIPQLFIKSIFENDTAKAEQLVRGHELYGHLFDEKHMSYIRQVYEEWLVEHEKVKELGGLHIIGTERHESRRVDNQLRGRAGRQGDPGFSCFYMSLEDDLFRLFGSDRMIPWLDRAGFTEDEVIESRLISRMIEGSQKKVEARNFEIRKHLLQYDEVMNAQRKIVYRIRDKVLFNEDLQEDIVGYMQSFVQDEIQYLMGGKKTLNTAQSLEIIERIEYLTELSLSSDELLRHFDALPEYVWNRVLSHYQERKENIGVEMFRQAERLILIEIIDEKWKGHLYDIDDLREGISLRSYGERNPLVEYQLESARMFEDMIISLQEILTYRVFHLRFEAVNFNEAMEKRAKEALPTQYQASLAERPVASPIVNKEAKIGRNEPCPCGSGKKYKHCHGKDS